MGSPLIATHFISVDIKNKADIISRSVLVMVLWYLNMRTKTSTGPVIKSPQGLYFDLPFQNSKYTYNLYLWFSRRT